jgi:hypothetical protein
MNDNGKDLEENSSGLIMVPPWHIDIRTNENHMYTRAHTHTHMHAHKTSLRMSIVPAESWPSTSQNQTQKIISRPYSTFLP